MTNNNTVILTFCIIFSIASAATVSIPSCIVDKSSKDAFEKYLKMLDPDSERASCSISTDSEPSATSNVTSFCTKSTAGSCCITYAHSSADGNVVDLITSLNAEITNSLILVNTEKHLGSIADDDDAICTKDLVQPGASSKCKIKKCGVLVSAKQSSKTGEEKVCLSSINLTYKFEKLIRTSCAGNNFKRIDSLPDGKCFPASVTVELEAGHRVRMDELSIGDRVRVGSGEEAFSTVFMFTHKAPDAVSDFVRLESETGATLVATAGHFLHAGGKLTAAGEIQVGDLLTLASGEQSRVAAISTVRMNGLYNPQTAHGDIVVDGLLASTYTSAVEPNAAHTILAPLRAAYKWLGARLSILEQKSPVALRV